MILALLILLCPPAPAGQDAPAWIPLPKGCAAPFDGVLWEPEAEADLFGEHAELEALQVENRRLGNAVQSCHAGAAAEADRLRRAAQDAGARASAEARNRQLAEQAAEDARSRVSILPSWAWALAGAAVVVAIYER